MMELKNQPNPNGCLAKALPDEPFFVLLARDLAAPAAIHRWANERSRMSVEDEKAQDADQIVDALDTAAAMETWRAQNDGRWREPREPDVVAVLPPGLDSELLFILGRPNFWCAAHAHVFQAAGHVIGKRSEDEQASVIHRMLRCYFLHGSTGWRAVYSAELSAAQALADRNQEGQSA